MFLPLFVIAVGFLAGVRGDCGCLKCSKGLTVISPPSSPVKVILRGKLPSKFKTQGLLQNYFNQYALPPTFASYPPEVPSPLYGAQVQIPYIPPPPTPLITPLAPAPDRIVLPVPEVELPVRCPFSSSGPIMETVAIPPPCDDRPMMSVQEVPFYPQYAYPPAPSYCPCQGYVFAPHESFERKIRTKRALLPHRHYRPPLPPRHHSPLGLLRSPFHFFLRTIPKLLTFPIMQFLRMLTGDHHNPILRSEGLYDYDRPRRDDLLQSKRYGYPDAELRRYPEMGMRSKRFKAPPSRSILIAKLRKINELTRDVASHRRKRSLAFDVDEESAPFYKVSEIDEDVDGGGDEDDNDEIVGREFLKPLHFKQMIPHNPIFYLLNTPIRLLSHLDNLKNQIRPVVSTIPLVIQNSKKYLMDFGRQFHNHILDFASNLIGDFDHAPHFRPLRPLLPKARYRRSASIFAQFLQNSGNKSEEDSFEKEYSIVHEPMEYIKVNRSKRFVLKMVDEKEVEDFLKEKLGDDDEKEEKVEVVANETPRRKKKLMIEPLTPKLIIDRKGKTFVEMNGLKRPFSSRRRLKQKIVDSDDIDTKISNLIEQAKSATQIVGGATYDSSMYLQVIRDKIKQTLTDINDLINTDFTKYTNLYENLRQLQNLKTATVNDWKTLLINNDFNSKIHILNSLQQIQTNRAALLKTIISLLDERNSFMTPRLIKLLVRLQKLQCVVYSVVEDFDGRMQSPTLFDPQREIRYVEHLDAINFVNAKTKEEVETYLRKERDGELERHIAVLERLRGLLEMEDVGRINEEARLLWEMRNIEKLQQDSIRELSVKIEQGQKVRKELKILFDLQRQLEVAEKKQEEILQEEVVAKSQPDKRAKPKRVLTANKDFRITPLVRSSSWFSNAILKAKKPVKVVTNDYTVVGYLTKHK